MATRRRLRMATRFSSAVFRARRTSSFRRSSVSSGTVIRTTWPSVVGAKPRSDWRMARSMAFTAFLSKGWIRSSRGSGAETVASCFKGVRVCQYSACTRSKSAGEARQVRMAARSLRVDSMTFFIRSSAALRISASLMTRPTSDEGSDSLAQTDAPEGPRGLEVEDDDGNAVLHAEGGSGRVHDGQALVEEVQVVELIVLLGRRIHPGVGAVDAVHPPLGHEDDLRL